MGSIPAATATSADLVFLTHEHTLGARDDATVTIGFVSNSSVAGYSDGEVNAALGSIDAVSPLVELFGLGDATDYLIETVYSFNRSWLEEFDNILIADTSYVLGPVLEVSGGILFFRRITGYPENLSAATLALNFERTDGTFYFTDAATSTTEEGLYQKVDDGQGELIYDRLTSRGFLHHDGVGAPIDPPTRAGEAYMDDLGRQWNAAGQVHISITDPTGTTATVAAADFGSQYVPDPASYGDLMTRGGEGAWYVERYNANFPQIQGTAVADIVLSNTFRGVYTWIVANVTGANTATNRFYRDNTTFLGSFHRLQDALNELQLVLQGEAFPPVSTHLYLWSDSTVTAAGVSRIKRILTFAAGAARRSDDFHWVGPIGADDQAAGEVPVDATQFGGNLAISGDTDVQSALETIDGFSLGGGGGGGGTVSTDATLDGDGSTGDPLGLADDAVTTAKIIDGAVTTAKMGPEAVTEGEMGNLAVTTAKIADDAVTHPKLAPNSVHGDRIQAAAITTAKIADGAVESDKIGANAVVEGKLPIDNTLAWDGSGQLSVNVTDVIDSLNETVEYYSDETGNEYDDGGHASMGEDYDTSAHRHIIHKVQIDINGADTTNGFWRAGVFAIDAGGDITAVLGRSDTEGIDVDQRHTFVFPNPVEVPASQRIRILGSRVDNDGESGSGTRSAHLSRGEEETASPRESYDDAHLDFARIRHVRVNHAFPDVGDTTHDHDADSVRGDIKIYYTVKLDHGDLVGDGNVNAAHIDSESATDGQVLTADGSGGAAWEAAPAGGGSYTCHRPRRRRWAASRALRRFRLYRHRAVEPRRGGASTFLGLTDTPSARSAQPGRWRRSILPVMGWSSRTLAAAAAGLTLTASCLPTLWESATLLARTR